MTIGVRLNQPTSQPTNQPSWQDEDNEDVDEDEEGEEDEEDEEGEDDEEREEDEEDPNDDMLWLAEDICTLYNENSTPMQSFNITFNTKQSLFLRFSRCKCDLLYIKVEYDLF